MARSAPGRRKSCPIPRLIEPLEPRRLLAANLVISEFLASNDTNITDSFGNREDWLELHNAGDEAANLNDYFLTDNAGNPEKWRFPVQTLDAGAYLIVFASGRDLATAGSELHTNFALAAGGEYLGLIRASDSQPQFQYAPTFPAQSADISYGLQDADNPLSTRMYFTTPTPGAANLLSVESPVFSTPGRTFTGLLQISLSTATPGAQIYYTTNSSIPTVGDTGTEVYAGPINVSTITRVRARAFAPGYNSSPIVSHTYLHVNSSVETFNSNLPIVVLESFGAGTTMGDATYVSASATFIDTGEDGRADMLDAPQFSGRIGLRYRGSTSLGYPKKQFAVEVRDEADGDKNASILGLPADSDWVLYAPYTEKSLMHNELAQRWFREMGHYSSNVRWVEVYHNANGSTSIDYTGDYLGVYMLMEKPKIDDNRVNIAKLHPTDTAEPEITGGYLFKKDRKEAQEIAFDTVGGAAVPWQRFVMVDPDETELTGAQLAWLTNYMNELDAVMQTPSFSDPANGYAKYIDVDSWVDFWILAETTRSVDAFWLSTFLYKPRGGKVFMGPAWDFNYAFGQANYRNGASASGWNHESLILHQNFGWQYGYFSRLFQDPNFRLKVTDRWQVLRKSVLATDKILTDIDANVAILSDNNGNYPIGSSPPQASNNALVRNFKKWPVLGTYQTGNSYFDPPGRWIEDVNMLKSWIKARVEWIDTQFASAPVLSPSGGSFGSATNVTITPKTLTTPLDTLLLAPGAPARAIVPTAAIPGWQGRTFDATSWPLSGTTGVGYDTTTTPVNYNPLIGLNVRTAMQNVNTSIFIRVEFNVADPAAVDHLILKMKYDDGFYAWVNGVRVIEANQTPENSNPVHTGNALAARDENAALQYVEWDISSVKPLLVAGTNVLAIQGLNTAAGNNDLLIMPEIVSRSYQYNTAGSVYYTTDGSDPRLPDGNIHPSAQLYTAALNIAASTRIRARTLNAGVWSGLADEIYNFDANNLRVTELMYNPPAPPAGSPYTAQDFEFIEVKNIGASPLNLNGLAFTAGISFTFPDTILAPGAYGVIVKHLGAFQSRYGTGLNVLGVFASGNLDNGGETLTLQNGFGQTLHSFAYNDAWHLETDGGGYSLVIRNANDALENWNVATAWRASHAPLGLPAQADEETIPPALQGGVYTIFANRVDLTFSEPISITPGTSVLELLTSTSISPTSHSAAGNVASIGLPILNNGIYRLTIPAASITDAVGNPMAADAVFTFLLVKANQTLVLPTSASTYTIHQLLLAGGAKLDLTNNTLSIPSGDAGAWNGASYTGISGQIQSGRNGGAPGTLWNGNGIVTSMPLAASQIKTVALAPTGSSLTIAYAFTGDATLDGVIDGDDYFAIDAGFASSSAGYANGDFDYNGRVDADDYWLIDSNYNKAQQLAASVFFSPAAIAADDDDPSAYERLIDDNSTTAL